MTADRPGTSKSGPRLTKQHDRCQYAPRPCACHQGANVVGTQANLWDNGDSKTAPGVASTNTGSLDSIRPTGKKP